MRRVAAPVALLFGVALLAGAPSLPGKGPGKLSADGPVQTFTGENLYDHIDGGAELFLELGFERCEVRRYAARGAEVTVERYVMRDTAAALGVYRLQCGRESPDPTLAERHTLGTTQLLLVKGPALLRLTGPPGRCPAPGQLAAFARELASALPAQEIDPFAPLPPEGRIAGSERVVRGPVSLSALAPPFDADALPLAGATALAADYGPPAAARTHLFADLADAPSAEKALDSLAAHLEAGTTAVSRAPASLSWKDASGRPGQAVAEGRRLRIVWGGGAPASP